jgi:hypothetical protein
MDSPKVAKRNWNPEEQLDELMLEFQFDQGDAAATTARLLREHALVAAESIAHLSAHAGNERVRLQASVFIVERVLESRLDNDLKLQQSQIALIGQALTATIRGLGLRFDFDPDSPVVKSIAHEALSALAGKELGE